MKWAGDVVTLELEELVASKKAVYSLLDLWICQRVT